MKTTALVLCAKTLVATLALVFAGHAMAYPDRPIRWIVPFPPAGAMDGIARVVGEQLSRHFGQPVVVENRPGAGGNIGKAAVARAPADGHTMLITAIGMATNRHLYRELSFDPIKDFAPVSLLAVVPNVLVVNPQRVQARRLPELVAELKAQPGRFTYASAGIGTSIHLAGELFTALTGTQMVHVPFRGSGPAVSALLGGQVDMMFDSVASARPHVQSGRLVALGVTTTTRSTAMPEVPTLQEAGLKGYELAPWFGVFMPAGTPENVINTMNQALREAMQVTEVKARFAVLGAEPVGSTPQALAARLAAETEAWGRLIRERNIRAE